MSVAITRGSAAAKNLNLTGEARGYMARRGASVWEAFDANDAGKVVMGNGTDVVSQSLSGDVSAVSSAGALTLANPQRLLVSTVSLDSTNIVGTGAGTLGHTSGVTLVSAPGASKLVVVERIVVRYTFATAAYTGGGNVSALYATNATSVTGTLSAANGFANGGNWTQIFIPAAVYNSLATIGTNEAIMLRSTAGFTQPGTAAGTASVKTYYRIIDETA